MPDRRSVLAGIGALPIAAYLPWPVAEQWEFRWALKPEVRRSDATSVLLNCLVRFPDGHTQEFRKRPVVTGCMRAVMGEADAVDEGLRYQIYKRAIEIKRDAHLAWWHRCERGPTKDNPVYRREMYAFSEDLSDVDLPEWLPHA